MIKKIEIIAKGLIAVSLLVIFINWSFSEPANSAFTVAADVSSTMVSCTTPLDGATNNFGTIDNSEVYAATTSTTTISSSGAIYMKVYSTGSTARPGLWKDPDLVESPNAAEDATATLAAGTEGYGITATTTDTNLVINTRYAAASSTNIVGGLATSTYAKVVASSSAAVSGAVVNVDYKAAVAISTPGGSYADTITFSCTATP